MDTVSKLACKNPHRTALRWGLFVLAAVVLAACTEVEAKFEKEKPVVVEPVGDTGISRVMITEKAAERLGLETMHPGEDAVPYSAIIYDTDGSTWVYANPEPLTFVRQRVMVDRIEGQQALLSEKLPPGLEIVTVGAIELYGAETGVGK